MEKRKIIGNSIAILINRLIQSITSFVLVAFIARILGPYSLGQYTLAFSYYFIFMTFASQGLKTFFIRELSRYPQQTPTYLINGTLLQLFFSLISYLALVSLVLIMPYSSDTSAICYILGSMIIPFSLSNITEAIFQAQEKMYLIPISTTPIYILRALIIVGAINLKYDLRFVCISMVISEFVILGIQWSLLISLINLQWQIKWDFIWDNFKSSRAFLAIEGMAILKGRMLVIILSVLANEVLVGLYSSVSQLMEPFEIIAHSLVVAVFPSMSKAVILGKEKQRALAETVIEILLCVALPLIIGLFFIGDGILVLFYGDPRFAEGAMALKIMVTGLAVSSFTRPLGYLLVANGFERVNLIEVTSNNLLTVVIGLPLVYYYHLTGAAITILILSISCSSQYVYAVYTRLFPLNIRKIIFRPLLISILILSVFLILKLLTNNLIIMMITSTVAYTIFVVFLAIDAIGGPNIVLSKIFK